MSAPDPALPADRLDHCGHTVIDDDGIEEPCGRPVAGWRWYQDVEHEDCLETACDRHSNEGGRRIHEAEDRAEFLEHEFEHERDRCGEHFDNWMTARAERDALAATVARVERLARHGCGATSAELWAALKDGDGDA